MSRKPSTITKFGRQQVRQVSDEAEAALQAVAEKYGLVLKRESGRYSANNFTAKFSFAVKAADGSDAPASFARQASLLGLPEDCYGKVFQTWGGKSYKVTGINLRARKYPVLGECLRTGKTFKFMSDSVKHGLKMAEAA
jgi:hypothetical protein